MADKYSSRNTKFNYYTDNDTIKSINDYTAGKKDKNITLLDYDDYTKVSGAYIIDDAQKNPNAKWMGTTINTDGISSSSSYYLYGSPEKWVLDNHQQYNNCGVDSCLNTLVMAGVTTIADQNKTETNFTQEMLDQNCCADKGTYGYLDTADGGTSIESYEAILEDIYGIATTTYGTSSHPEGLSIEDLVKDIILGKCVIVAVCADLLWDREVTTPELNHAICVTGVVLDTNETTITINNVKGFYIHDTGAWATRYITCDDLKDITLYEDHQIYAAITDATVKSGTNNINATGNSLANTITGNSGDNIIKGQGGNDTLYGQTGNDTIYGGSGNDLIYANDTTPSATAYENVLYGDSGNDTIYGDNGYDIINGGTGNDSLYGNDGNDTIHGNDGNDKIYGGDGINKLYGDAGNDIIEGGNDSDIVNGGNGNDTINGNNGDDSLDGGKGNDTICGNDGNDEINGDEGNDSLHGNDGNDTIYGGKGNDIINGDAGNDEINGNDGNDSLYGNTGNDTIYGGNGNDYISDDNGANVIYGDNGNDNITITSTDGQLIYGDDKENTKKGNDTITTSSGNDTIYSGQGNDKIYSGDGADSITCYSGNNYVESGDGADTITCGNGKDTILGGSGNDSISCGGGNDTIIMDENWGNDTIESSGGRNILKFTGSSIANEIYARNMDFSINSDDLIINYNSNKATYSDFYDSTQGGYYPVYLQDDEYKYNVSCNMTATGAEKYIKIKVENSKGNNILLTENNTAQITTSKYADIVYMDEGNDTITYTGGQDYYYSTSGADEYIIQSFNKNTDLEINDKASTDDTIIIQTKKSNINLFFDVNSSGKTTSNTGLSMFCDGKITDVLNYYDAVTVDNYFTEGKSISSGESIGDGYIENIEDSTAGLDISQAVQSISSDVVNWLIGTSYTSAYDVMAGDNTDHKTELLNLYMGYEINYI